MTARGIIHLAAVAATTTNNNGMPSCLPTTPTVRVKTRTYSHAGPTWNRGEWSWGLDQAVEIGRRWVATLWQNYRLQEKRNHVTIMTEEMFSGTQKSDCWEGQMMTLSSHSYEARNFSQDWHGSVSFFHTQGRGDTFQWDDMKERKRGRSVGTKHSSYHAEITPLPLDS